MMMPPHPGMPPFSPYGMPGMGPSMGPPGTVPITVAINLGISLNALLAWLSKHSMKNLWVV